jgi:hypothetical protein
MPHKGQGVRGEGQAPHNFASHLLALALFAALAIVWTWPLVLHFHDHIPGLPGDNFSFLWNLWWMRKALAAPNVSFFHSVYLFSPFGVDLVNHPHTALQGLISATLLAKLSIIEAENLLIVFSLFLNAACAYALAFDITRNRRLAVLAGVAFGGSPYVAAHLLGHFDLLTAWVIPLFALFFRRALIGGKVIPAIVAGLCAAIAAYSAYDHVVYIALFAIVYSVAWWNISRVERPVDAFWRGIQALMIVAATFAICCLTLITQAFRILMLGRFVTETYFVAPRGVDTLTHGLDRIKEVGWLGVIPIVVLLVGWGAWLDEDEARRWKAVLVVFAILALGPFLMFGGRAMVCVYLALGVLMALRLGALETRASRSTRLGSPAVQWALVALLAFGYLNAPIPLTALDRPVVYDRLASIDENGGVIEVPFGIGDGLSQGIGDQNRRVLYYATIHGHPLVGGYIGRMPTGYVAASEAMPVVGNLLRLSNGETATEEPAAQALPFRYLVLDTRTASPELIQYVKSALDMDLIASGDGKELYAVQGVRPPNLRAAA